MKKLAIDFEFASRTWWENGGQDLWDAVTEGFDGSGVLVDDDLAKSWMAQAASIDGWNDGTEYAPHPVRASEVDEDEAEELA
ncbi:MAG: hypothetical protein AAF430_16285 [Myxococcota bacterium]